jgi:Tfp pilus assembly protein PilF
VAAVLVTAGAAAAPPDTVSRPPATPARTNNQRGSITLEGRNRALSVAKLAQQLSPTLDNERTLADEYLKAGVLDAALDHYDAALRLDPHDVPSLDGVARIWRDWGYANVALSHAYRALYWAPDSAAVHNTLGTLLLKLNFFDGARGHFERARTLAPGAAYPVNNLCYLELQRANADDAVTLCREAAERDPGSPTVRNNYALALATTGDFDAAVSTFDSGMSPAADAYNQGLMLLAAGQRDRARAAFSRARQADPAFLPALARLKQLAAAPAEP